MLDIGNGNGTFKEYRAHFGAWCITSSPLILSFDLCNKLMLKEVWSIISNKAAIAVNQAWNGDAGRLVYSGEPHGTDSEYRPHYVWVMPCDDFDDYQQGWSLETKGETGELRWSLDGARLKKSKEHMKEDITMTSNDNQLLTNSSKSKTH